MDSFVNFLSEAWLTIVALWQVANNDVYDHAMPVVRGFVIVVFFLPVLASLSFLVGFTGAIPTIGIVGILLLVWYLFWRFQYPLVYAALVNKKGRAAGLHLVFVIASMCFFSILLAAIGTFAIGGATNEYTLRSIVVFGLLTAGLLSIGVKSDRQKTLKAMISWTIGIVALAIILLAFPQVREKLPVSREATGESIASIMPGTTKTATVPAADLTKRADTTKKAFSEESVENLAPNVPGTSRYADVPVEQTGPLEVVAEASGTDTVTTAMNVSWRENTRLRVVATEPIIVLSKQFDGTVKSVTLKSGEDYFYARNESAATGPDQMFRFTRASAGSGMVRVVLQVASNKM